MKVYILLRWYFAFGTEEIIGVFYSEDLAQTKESELRGKESHANFYILKEEVIYD